MQLAIIIMAAGKGTRMKSDLPKVLHQANGKPIVSYVIEKSLALQPERTILIIGHKGEMVRTATQHYSGIEWALQEPQLGTGHAVMQAEPALEGFRGDILILSGDAPLITETTIANLQQHHHTRSAAATVLTADMDDPTGYGRIIRNAESGDVEKIVEQKDASPEEQKVQEINSGVYMFNAEKLFGALKRITNTNAQQEYYLTDVFGIFFNDGERISAYKTPHGDEIRGINTPDQLREAEELLRDED
ncbi:sugar phosphate nucleotidyltransferase [Prosthecochloris sp. CIB 2401]|uniref:sugar phosphate nucleotidyltransferase n=1 Tax=Prosthecochloris sp. CIB 2401 TaxID=1868325 RepID=UPI00080A9EA5|nr:sugar phosphate nucleotidyltransferase [Prosthecochloris sp. CIB 2401]ANT64195.1 Bifunctional protein GlmU [Prosthecochloris sp. CIB 2401]